MPGVRKSSLPSHFKRKVFRALDFRLFMLYSFCATLDLSRETTNMKRKIENPHALNRVQSMRNSEGQPIGTWLLQSITPVLFRVFYDEKFFYRDLLKFG